MWLSSTASSARTIVQVLILVRISKASEGSQLDASLIFLKRCCFASSPQATNDGDNNIIQGRRPDSSCSSLPIRSSQRKRNFGESIVGSHNVVETVFFGELLFTEGQREKILKTRQLMCINI